MTEKAQLTQEIDGNTLNFDGKWARIELNLNETVGREAWLAMANMILDYYDASRTVAVPAPAKPCEDCASRAAWYQEHPPEESPDQIDDKHTIRHTLMVGGGRR